jgi:hypothetical protein
MRASRQRDHVRDSAIQKRRSVQARGAGTSAPENGELVAKGEILDGQVGAGADGRPGSRDEGEEEPNHWPILRPWAVSWNPWKPPKITRGSN